MQKGKGAVLLSGIILSFLTFTSQKITATILPENDLGKYDLMNFASANLDENTFNRIADDILNIYVPVAAKFGAILSFDKKWDDSTVNAFARQSGTSWTINLFGGLARRPEITVDGFALVICHELGHHFGGYPFYEGNNWAAAEGEADYFAAQTCLKRYWRDDTATNAESRKTVNTSVKRLCDIQYKDEGAQNICYRTGNAGLSVANLMAALEGGSKIAFETVDLSEVATTNTAHPRAQCRLDTYFAGAICPISNQDSEIPGRKNSNGQESRDAEMRAAPYSCLSSQLQPVGARPLCWFSPIEKTPLLSFANIEFKSSRGDDSLQAGDRVFVKPALKNNTEKNWNSVEFELNASLSLGLQSAGKFKADEIKASSSFDKFDPQALDVTTDAKCGQPANFYFDVQSKALGFGRLLYKDIFGKKSENIAKSDQEVEIPDSHWEDAASTIETTDNDRITGLKMFATLDHERLSDVKLSLLTPWQTKYDFPDFGKDQTGKIDVEFMIPVPSDATNGNFVLMIKDAVKGKTGKLISWGLKIKKVNCSK